MDDAPERLRERGQRDDDENPPQDDGKNSVVDAAQPTQTEPNGGPAAVTIAEPGRTNVGARRDPWDDGQMHD